MVALCCLVQFHLGLDHSVGTNLSAVRGKIGVTREQIVGNSVQVHFGFDVDPSYLSYRSICVAHVHFLVWTTT
jgi:hypothetical protein